MGTSVLAPGSVAVARQPICDVHLTVRAYELLHRGTARDGEAATAQVLLAAMGDIGLPALVGGRPAFVNVSRRFLLDVDPLPFPPGALGLELLEDQLVDDALVARLAELVASGYVLSLDDFAYTPEAEPLLELAEIVKVDVRAGGIEHAAAQARLLGGRDLTLLAEKVEDEQELAACRELGFELFQGFFFCRPMLVSGREIPASSALALQAAAVLSRTDASFEEIEDVVTRDPGLSLRLLRLLNSAAYARRRRIGTVREALTMLGARTVRQWAMVLVLGGISTRCDELVPVALTRGRALADLAGALGEDPDEAFAVGLFSVADALLGVPMQEALRDVPLADAVADALTGRTGVLGVGLAAVLAYERDEAPLAPPGTTLEALAMAYTEAIGWAQERSGTALAP